MSDTNKAILQRANAAIAAGDPEGFLAFCTDDIEWTTVGEGTLRGKEAVRQWMATEYAEPPDFTADTWIEEGDFLTVLGHITANNRDGTPTRHAYCDVWRFRDGRMAELKAFVIEAEPR